ncbi:hypothetical protein [Flavobacterium sp. ov086]|uniref:hypothetical protein n=1 Tax=Flavobacterium sp. ov086 TaxID=1761785 RepID=UPI000B741C44|nr:hypothetical protein [Flavobacterium sp. ov086]SNR31352.1 Predicted chitinase [Flavobacterium sp. ov086]
MSNFKIIGNPNPEVGKEVIYTVSNSILPESFLPGQTVPAGNNPFTEQVKWSVYILEYGKWNLKEKNNKIGPTANYTFNQISLSRKGIRIVAQLGEEKATLDIKPIDTIERKIVKVELCDALGNLQTKPFAYNQTVIARVHCTNLDNCAVHVTLWEDDAPGAGHSQINKNNKAVTKSELVSNGIADIKFKLDIDFAKMANAQLAKGDKSEGKTHEYYVTAEVFRQKTVSSNNINVINPDHKTTNSKPAAQKPVKPRSAAPAETKGKSKKEEKGIKEPVTGTIYDWSEAVLKAIPMILPDPIEVVNSLAKVFMPDKKEEKKGECPNCEKDITLDDIERTFGIYTKHKIARQEIVKYINEFIKLSKKNGKPVHLDTCLRKAHFFAQVGTETLGINPDWMVETDTKRYTVANCKATFGDRAKYLERVGLLDDYCNDNPQKRLLNYVYGNGNGFDNGNGNEASGDGYKFRGRGLKQITGRGNYKDASKILKDVFPEHFIDLEVNPDKVKEAKYAVLTAFAYWEKHEIWKVADTLKDSTDSNIKKIRGKVNPGLKGWKECKVYFEKGIEVFKVNNCEPTTVSENKEDNGKWRFPIDNPMLCMYSQGGGHKPWHGSFGERIRDGSANHTGNDLLAKPETKVYACVRSKVHKIYTSSSMAGNVVVLKVLDVETFKSLRNENYVPKYQRKGEILERGFDSNGTIYLTFWHLSKNDFFNEGDEVSYNDIIGLTGISGRNGNNFITRNPHLHFEVSNVGSAAGLNGKCNPSVYFKFKTEDELSQTEIDFQNNLKDREWR